MISFRRVAAGLGAAERLPVPHFSFEVSEGCVAPIWPIVVPFGIHPSAALPQGIGDLDQGEALFHQPKVALWPLPPVLT
jgi:hypothetical protein